MMTVCLTTDGRTLVTYAHVPPFKAAPDVVVWGTRIFSFVAWNGDLSNREKVLGCPKDIAVYFESFAVTAVEENTPRTTFV